MREIRTEIRIAAPARRVWEVLTDFARHPEWNPFIRSISGELREGGRLRVHIVPPGGRGMTFRPTIRALRPERELRWLGRLGVPGLFDGEHAFELEPLGEDAVRLVHRERFSGLLVGPFWGGMEAPTRRGFEAMNQALRAEAEGGGAS